MKDILNLKVVNNLETGTIMYDIAGDLKFSTLLSTISFLIREYYKKNIKNEKNSFDLPFIFNVIQNDILHHLEDENKIESYSDKIHYYICSIYDGENEKEVTIKTNIDDFELLNEELKAEHKELNGKNLTFKVMNEKKLKKISEFDYEVYGNVVKIGDKKLFLKLI